LHTVHTHLLKLEVQFHFSIGIRAGTLCLGFIS
jgi:hypothetical protein